MLFLRENMKLIAAVKNLLYINLLCLLWQPYFCDKELNNENLQGLHDYEALSTDPNRVGNVPTEQKETVEKENIGAENYAKGKEIQSDIENVNSNLKTKHIKPEALEISQPNVNLEQIKKSTISNLESSRQIKLNEDFDSTQNSIKRDERKEESLDIPVVKYSEGTEPLTLRNGVETPEESLPTNDNIKITKSTVTSKLASLDMPASHLVEKGEVPKDGPISASIDFMETMESGQQQPQYEGMPSFDEWKKMMLAEQEKGGQKVPSPSPPGKKISSQKRRRNYSSYECGAKIVASNSEAEGKSRILNELVDDYMLNPCKAKIWFVIELCETVQATQIELANFELFSSCPKDFAVYSSDNFPSRDWVLLGTFTAAEQRVLQSFELKQEGFGKFIKIELLSYYGKEHYCPLSIVRIFGTSMVDEYEEMETLDSHTDVPDDDLDRLDIPIEDQGASNLFGSATDAVFSIVKKAAQALGQQTLEESQNNDTTAEQQNVSETKICKLISESSAHCEDVSVKNNETSVPSSPEYTEPPSSVHQSLFRFLRRCDQCISPRIGYYSAAQPHCRFFQVALGPVVFQSLCDWFKDHSLDTITEMAASLSLEKDSMTDGLFTISPSKSPPPQIMRIPLDSDVPITIVTLNNSSTPVLSHSDKRVVLNLTSVPSSIINGTLVPKEGIKLEPSIHITQTVQKSQISVSDGDREKVAVTEKSAKSLHPKADTVGNLPLKASITIPDKTEVPTERSITDSTPGVLISSSAVVQDVLGTGDTEETEIEPSSETSTISTEDIDEVASATEFKSGDEKLSDMRSDLNGKPDSITTSGITAGQKESVFMRMSNRIKSLEINMSLSSQYLQELSQRYRRQMEDMQRAFNRTIGTLNDTARKAADKDLKQQEVINSLQLQVSNLTHAVELLLNERSYVLKEMVETHVCLMVVEAIIMITIMSLCVRRISSSGRQIAYSEREMIAASPRCVSKRRNSADSSTPPIARKVKKRSVSEEALTAGEDLLIVEPLPVLTELSTKVKKKNRKRNRGLQRSVSQPTVQPLRFSSTSQYSVKHSASHSDGCITKVSARHSTCRTNHTCENCNTHNCIASKVTERERRSHTQPLQNLTNGIVEACKTAQQKKLEKTKFSFRKILKFSKRDSI